ncbi:MAG: hypothetical protein ACYDDV_01475 [Methanoregula sp.]
MNHLGLAVTYLGSFFTAFIAALAILAIEKWWNEKNDFKSCIRGLETEIKINVTRINELKALLTEYLKDFDEFKRNGAMIDIPPIVLLHDSFDYCRFKGHLSKLSDEQRNNINYLYSLSDLITTFVSRDFQLSLFETGEARFANKKLVWQQLIIQIDEYNKKLDTINFNQIIK